jgi:hypothetical protein
LRLAVALAAAAFSRSDAAQGLAARRARRYAWRMTRCALVALLLFLAACPSRAPEGAARTLGDAAPSSVTSIAVEARVPDGAPPPAPDGAAAAGAQAARLDPARCPPATVLVDGAPMEVVSARARRFRVPEGAYTIALSTVCRADSSSSISHTPSQ